MPCRAAGEGADVTRGLTDRGAADGRDGLLRLSVDVLEPHVFSLTTLRHSSLSLVTRAYEEMSLLATVVPSSECPVRNAREEGETFFFQKNLRRGTTEQRPSHTGGERCFLCVHKPSRDAVNFTVGLRVCHSPLTRRAQRASQGFCVFQQKMVSRLFVLFGTPPQIKPPTAHSSDSSLTVCSIRKYGYLFTRSVPDYISPDESVFFFSEPAREHGRGRRSSLARVASSRPRS